MKNASGLPCFFNSGVHLDKAIGVERFFRLNSVLIGFVALRSEYASILRSGRRAAKKRCLPKIFDLKREDFFVLEVEERSNTSDETNKTGKYSVSGAVIPRVLCLCAEIGEKPDFKQLSEIETTTVIHRITVVVWRSGWDSNPRYREVQLISSVVRLWQIHLRSRSFQAAL